MMHLQTTNIIEMIEKSYSRLSRTLRAIAYVSVHTITYGALNMHLNPRLLASTGVVNKNIPDWMCYVNILMHAIQSFLTYYFNLGISWYLVAKYPLYILLSTYYLVSLRQIAWSFAIDALSLLAARAGTNALHPRLSRERMTRASITTLFTFMASVLISVFNYSTQKLYLNSIVLGNVRDVVTSLIAPPLPLQYIAHVPIGYVLQKLVFEKRNMLQSLMLMVFFSIWNCAVPFTILFCPHWIPMCQVLFTYITQAVIVILVCWAISL
ncbi:bouquet formation protein Bqt3 [Schizosaccharomyces cryophilus OY26]|uniref:Bouquet formation protein Bqt3 n=1 Tax=Schizosaccharomyces cryophilus (strain OY26 / ATCC MYA-4695 / CBS 11777 / NBRC 106824 / NRRL Y48691) TaxID=653667 RepID=S9VUZ1_SCHCR|nr:bouquet formation protein Bqt3 [Schizosaccharomyces cryophilus OY26]EPY49999.1 bouquet formation protein Bqt3 [Schizosaccharomyces cryophilus OY26]